ncbi:MAG: hypothetical protein C4334_08980 [Pyrinomonas sp.]
MVALAAQDKMAAELTASGEVSVDGAKAITGATVFSGSTITTGQNSSAIVSIGKLGRIELLPNSSLKLTFSETGMTGSLEAGRVRVTSAAGSTSSITTKDGAVVADNTQSNAYMVDVECGNTIVTAQAGRVELRAGNEVKPVAAGQEATAGQAQPGTRCTRLRTEGMRGISGGGLAALLLAAGGAIAAAIIAATSSNNDLNFGGTPVVISPTR